MKMGPLNDCSPASSKSIVHQQNPGFLIGIRRLFITQTICHCCRLHIDLGFLSYNERKRSWSQTFKKMIFDSYSFLGCRYSNLFAEEQCPEALICGLAFNIPGNSPCIWLHYFFHFFRQHGFALFLFNTLSNGRRMIIRVLLIPLTQLTRWHN